MPGPLKKFKDQIKVSNSLEDCLGAPDSYVEVTSPPTGAAAVAAVTQTSNQSTTAFATIQTTVKHHVQSLGLASFVFPSAATASLIEPSYVRPHQSLHLTNNNTGTRPPPPPTKPAQQSSTLPADEEEEWEVFSELAQKMREGSSGNKPNQKPPPPPSRKANPASNLPNSVPAAEPAAKTVWARLSRPDAVTSAPDEPNLDIPELSEQHPDLKSSVWDRLGRTQATITSFETRADAVAAVTQPPCTQTLHPKLQAQASTPAADSKPFALSRTLQQRLSLDGAQRQTDNVPDASEAITKHTPTVHAEHKFHTKTQQKPDQVSAKASTKISQQLATGEAAAEAKPSIETEKPVRVHKSKPLVATRKVLVTSVKPAAASQPPAQAETAKQTSKPIHSATAPKAKADKSSTAPGQQAFNPTVSKQQKREQEKVAKPAAPKQEPPSSAAVLSTDTKPPKAPVVVTGKDPLSSFRKEPADASKPSATGTSHTRSAKAPSPSLPTATATVKPAQLSKSNNQHETNKAKKVTTRQHSPSGGTLPPPPPFPPPPPQLHQLPLPPPPPVSIPPARTRTRSELPNESAARGRSPKRSRSPRRNRSPSPQLHATAPPRATSPARAKSPQRARSPERAKSPPRAKLPSRAQSPQRARSPPRTKSPARTKPLKRSVTPPRNKASKRSPSPKRRRSPSQSPARKPSPQRSRSPARRRNKSPLRSAPKQRAQPGKRSRSPRRSASPDRKARKGASARRSVSRSKSPVRKQTARQAVAAKRVSRSPPRKPSPTAKRPRTPSPSTSYSRSRSRSRSPTTSRRRSTRSPTSSRSRTPLRSRSPVAKPRGRSPSSSSRSPSRSPSRSARSVSHSPPPKRARAHRSTDSDMDGRSGSRSHGAPRAPYVTNAPAPSHRPTGGRSGRSLSPDRGHGHAYVQYDMPRGRDPYDLVRRDSRELDPRDYPRSARDDRAYYEDASRRHSLPMYDRVRGPDIVDLRDAYRPPVSTRGRAPSPRMERLPAPPPHAASSHRDRSAWSNRQHAALDAALKTVPSHLDGKVVKALRDMLENQPGLSMDPVTVHTWVPLMTLDDVDDQVAAVQRLAGIDWTQIRRPGGFIKKTLDQAVDSIMKVKVASYRRDKEQAQAAQEQAAKPEAKEAPAPRETATASKPAPGSPMDHSPARKPSPEREPSPSREEEEESKSGSDRTRSHSGPRRSGSMQSSPHESVQQEDEGQADSADDVGQLLREEDKDRPDEMDTGDARSPSRSRSRSPDVSRSRSSATRSKSRSRSPDEAGSQSGGERSRSTSRSRSPAKSDKDRSRSRSRSRSYVRGKSKSRSPVRKRSRSPERRSNKPTMSKRQADSVRRIFQEKLSLPREVVGELRKILEGAAAAGVDLRHINATTFRPLKELSRIEDQLTAVGRLSGLNWPAVKNPGGMIISVLGKQVAQLSKHAPTRGPPPVLLPPPVAVPMMRGTALPPDPLDVAEATSGIRGLPEAFLGILRAWLGRQLGLDLRHVSPAAFEPLSELPTDRARAEALRKLEGVYWPEIREPGNKINAALKKYARETFGGGRYRVVDRSPPPRDRSPRDKRPRRI